MSHSLLIAVNLSLAFLLFDAPALQESAEQKSPQNRQVDLEALNKAIQLGDENWNAIKTVHIKFRHFSAGRFKPGMTANRCNHLLGQFDLVKRPDDLGELIKSLVESDRLFDPPWGDSELYSDRSRTRTSSAWKTTIPNGVHITDDKISIRWDEANSQVDIELIQDNRMGQTKPDQFWRRASPWMKDLAPTNSIVRREGTITATKNDDRYSIQVDVDEQTGFQTRAILRDSDRGVTREEFWLGWETGVAKIPFPKVVIRLDYSADDRTLSFAEIVFVKEIALNTPLPETLFQLGAPAGSVIFDRRNGEGQGFQGRINHDVLDVTNVEQRRAAAKLLGKELSPEEKIGVEDLQRRYVLSDEVVLKRIGPPYPISRKYVRRMLGDGQAYRREVRSNVIEYVDGTLKQRTWFDGGSFILSSLITYLTGTDPTTIVGDAEILKRELPGDFIFRPDATTEQLLEQLTEIVCDEFQRPIRMSFYEVDMKVYIAKGTVKQVLPLGGEYVALNGGNHKGDHGESIGFGDVKALLAETSKYIQIKVIDETTPPHAKVGWSKRWYDLKTTPPEKRFKINPEIVLKQIKEQTGLTFTEDVRPFKILFVEDEDQ